MRQALDRILHRSRELAIGATKLPPRVTRCGVRIGPAATGATPTLTHFLPDFEWFTRSKAGTRAQFPIGRLKVLL